MGNLTINGHFSLPEGSWFYMHWELAILRYCADILSMFEPRTSRQSLKTLKALSFPILTPANYPVGWVGGLLDEGAMHKFRRFWPGITKQWGAGLEGEIAWFVFLAADQLRTCRFFGWHFLFSRGVSKIASEFDVLFGHECVLKKNSDNTSESLIAESQRHIWGGTQVPLGSATPNTVGSQLCCVFTPASWDQITDRDNKTHQPFGTAPKHSVWLHSTI